VEIHGAHDVTLNHILSPRTNRRTDRYSDGLTLVNEAVEAIRAEVGEDLILSFRMGCCFDWEKDIATAKRIEAMGFDLLNVSVGVQEGYAPGIPSDYDYTPMTYAASLLKQHVGIPVIAAWGIDTLRRGEQLIQKGEADLVAYGKSFLADPGFVTRSMGNPDYSPCVHCRACRWYSDGAKCPGRMRANRYAESGKS
jgi:2,4-dienoyl-CoA reductase-like NADH-dependent reductase (Old Yellow Enzyme family)